MRKRKSDRQERKATSKKVPQMFGCPGPVCRAVAREAVSTISRILPNGNGVVTERAKSADDQDALDRQSVGP